MGPASAASVATVVSKAKNASLVVFVQKTTMTTTTRKSVFCRCVWNQSKNTTTGTAAAPQMFVTRRTPAEALKAASGLLFPKRFFHNQQRPPPPPPPPPPLFAGWSVFSPFYYILACIPLYKFCRDNLVDVVRVEGRSMTPTIQPGDIILVQKADSGSLFRVISSLLLLINLGGWQDNDDGDDYDNETSSVEDQEQQQQKSSSLKFLTKTQEDMLRSKIKHYQEQHAAFQANMQIGVNGTFQAPAAPTVGWWYSRPPLVLPGQVVVFYSPEHFSPKELHIKRCWATGAGGSVVVAQQPQHSPQGSGGHWKRGGGGVIMMPCPHYALHVEGDNSMNSRDSRCYGVISQNLLQGVATHVIWPPSRWQRLKIAATPATAMIRGGGGPYQYW